MNRKPIDQARDTLLHKALPALKRAGKRALKEAEETGTCLIIGDGDKVIRINPRKESRSQKS